MQKIQTASKYLIRVFNTLLIVMPLWFILVWSFIDVPFINILIASGFIFNPVPTPEGTINLAHLTFTPQTKLLGFASTFLGVLPILLSLLILKAIFKNYCNGDIFISRNARHYKHLGWLFLLEGFIIHPLSNLLSVLTATLSNTPGHRYVVINFGTPNLYAVFCGLIIILVSWVMAEGHKIQEEQSFTV